MLVRVLCWVTFLFYAAGLSAQVVAAPAVGTNELLAPAATISKSVDEVNLSFTVTDKHGHFISNLGPEDFRLLDNAQSPRQLTFFQQRSNLPLHVAVLIDASSSVEYRFKFETAAAAAFLKNVLRPGKDEALVVTFNDEVKTVAAPTNNQSQLRAALRKIKPAGNTDLNGAVIYACHGLRQMPESQITRRAIILISDGVDTVHRASLQQAEQEASRSEVTIFSLTTNFSKEDANGQGDEVMRQLSAASGGTLLPAHEEAHLRSALHTIEKTLRNQYVLAYTPASFTANGKYRAVELQAVKHGFRTNCRKGYYARPAKE